MDPQEIIPQQVLPLAYSGFVTIGFTRNRNNAHLRVVRLHVGDVRNRQGHAFTFGAESDCAHLLLEPPGKPPGPEIIPDGQGREDEPQEGRID